MTGILLIGLFNHIGCIPFLAMDNYLRERLQQEPTEIWEDASRSFKITVYRALDGRWTAVASMPNEPDVCAVAAGLLPERN